MNMVFKYICFRYFFLMVLNHKYLFTCIYVIVCQELTITEYIIFIYRQIGYKCVHLNVELNQG